MAVLNLYTAEQSRQLDRITIEQYGLPGILLMKRAAFSAFSLLQAQWPQARRITVVCGVGNNGGDGFALVQYASLAGMEVNVLQLGTTHKIRGDALTMLHELSDLGLGGLPFSETVLAESDVIVDAIFGTGLDRPVEGEIRAAIDAINASGKPVLALDIPSGLHADTGQVLGTAIRASHTATFIGHKVGLHMEAGREVCGQIHFYDLGVPDEVYTQLTPAARLITLADCPLPLRPAFAHKGMTGTALLIGGNRHMGGAIALAAQAALHSGAGLTKVITRPEHLNALLTVNPALMVYDKPEPDLIHQADAIGLGPGLGQDDWSQTLFRQLLHHSGLSVLDADALNLLARTPARADDWVLTPHPSEAARLLGWTTQQVQADRLRAARMLQQRYGGVIVLKGAGTVITDGQQTFICAHGNAGMATGGMGDVLTGIITALLAQGLTPLDAARTGVCLHAKAGDLAAAQLGQRGLQPQQLMPFIQHLTG